MQSSPYNGHVVPFPRDQNSPMMRNEAQYFLEQFSNTHMDWIAKEAPWFELAPASNAAFLRLARNFLEKQAEFFKSGKPIGVQIAYHYTSERAMESIQREGLRTGVRGYYGKGIYVGNNPHAFRCYGEVGLIILILTGEQRKMYSSWENDVDLTVDSYHGNKLHRQSARTNGSRYFDETILRSSTQILPLLKYPRELVNNADLFWRFHVSLQKWVDQLFPHGWPSCPQRIFPNYLDIQSEFRLNKNQSYFTRQACPVKIAPILIQAATSLPKESWVGSETCNPVELKLEQRNSGFHCSSLFCASREKEECPICLLPLGTQNAVATIKCQHAFHQVCLDQALAMSQKCPICRLLLAEPAGKSPFGTMNIRVTTSVHCGGFDNVPTVVLTYKIPSGTQTTDHANPGQKFEGTIRKAYVPDNAEGRNLLKRLRYAFRRGLTFAVGTSLTSGKSNVVCWASIHHKTVPRGGAYGWPNPSYFANVNDELDGLGVPESSEL